MRKLSTHGRIAQFIERGRDGGANAVPSELVFISHTPERAIERVLAEGFQAPIARMRYTCAGFRFPQMTNDLLCLQRQWHDVWRMSAKRWRFFLVPLLALELTTGMIQTAP